MQLEIFHILKNLTTGNGTRDEIKVLYTIMYNLAREYFRRNNKNFIFTSGMLPEDAAVETILPLFTDTGEEQFGKLKHAFDKWRPEIKDNHQALYFIHQLIYIRCDHYLVNILKKMNPDTASFLNSLNNRIKKEGFQKQHYCGTVYIIADDKIVPGCKLIGFEDFSKISDKIFFNHKLLLQNIFQFLRDNLFFPAVPLYLIIEKITILYHREAPEMLISSSIDNEFYVEEAADAGLKISLDRLHISYNVKEKLTQTETEGFEKALLDIRIDLTDGGISGSYFSYLEKHLPGLEHSVFKIRYENIFEYLVKILKESTVKALKEND